VPLGTLKDWLQAPTIDPESVPPPETTDPETLTAQPHIRTILTEYTRWKGPFTALCLYLKEQHRLPYVLLSHPDHPKQAA